MFGGFAGVVGFAVVDVMVYGWNPALQGLRLVWGLAQLASGFYLLRCSPRGRNFTVLAASVVSSVGFIMLIRLTGGMASPYVIWLTALSMALAPTSRGATAVSSVILVFGTVAMFAGSPTWLAYSLSAMIAGGLAQYTAFLFHRARMNEARVSELLAISEQRRHESERLVVLGQLAGGVAHEINNPLGCIKGNVSYLAEAESMTVGERHQVLAETLSGVSRIAAIVRDLRTFASDEQPEVVPDNLRPMLDDALSQASVRLTEVKATLDFQVPRQLPRVLIQQERFSRVLVSLLFNAADAIERSASRRGQVRIQTSLVEGGLVLHVDDDGPGIDPKVLERIFDPFFTTKPPGKGIGLSLALAREYVTRVGGTIEASNLPAGGARFTITLRTEIRPAQPEPTAAASSSHASHIATMILAT